MNAFNSEKYYELQLDAIKNRVEKFKHGKLYLEIGGKLLYDGHAENVLPGFDPEVKVKILKYYQRDIDFFYCVNVEDIQNNRQLKSTISNYEDDVMEMLEKFEKTFGIKPKVVINKILEIDENIQKFQTNLQNRGYKTYKRYFISGYPQDAQKILGNEGFTKDDYIDSDRNLIIVTGAASNSGKLSTCLGQIFLDSKNVLDSGYAKYELFPIWNLPLDHPVNLAYEAATADIGDYNEYDKLHEENYSAKSVNYNRDIEAFGILKSIANEFMGEKNFIRSYKSPTDMGINMAGFCIEDDDKVRQAAIKEIKRRQDIFLKLFEKGMGEKAWVEKCGKLLELAGR